MDRWIIAEPVREFNYDETPVYRELQLNPSIFALQRINSGTSLDYLSYTVYGTELQSYRFKELNYQHFLDYGGTMPDEVLV